MKKRLLATVLEKSGLRAALKASRRWSGLLALNYHRIGSSRGSPFDHGPWSADRDSFAAQMRFLKANFDVVQPSDLERIVADGRGRYVMVTFDDGYRDNYTDAFPVLKDVGVPATFFIATGFLDRPRLPWWDEIAWMVRTCKLQFLDLRPWLPDVVAIDEPVRETAIRKLLRVYKDMPNSTNAGYLDAISQASSRGRFDQAQAKELWMTWDMVREMHRAGMTFGGHTVDHPILARMTFAQQQREIVECGRRIDEELSAPMTTFSYPVGPRDSFDDTTISLLKAAGVSSAFSYYGGVASFEAWDWFDIRRTAIEEYISLDWFKCLTSVPATFG